MTAHNLRFLLLGSLFFFLNQPIFSEETPRYYDIELVVFENREENPALTEIWPAGKQLVVPENAAILGRKFEGKVPPEFDPSLAFKTLAAKDYQLKDDVAKIRESDRYKLLLHTGWRQPGLAQNDVVSVYINHAVAENEGQTTADAPASPAPGQSATAEQPVNAVARIEALVSVALSRYLHLDAEMLYKQKLDSSTVDMFDSAFLEDRAGKDNTFYIKQNRRMRSKETHYIDHPKFGMLVRITPYEGVVNYTPPAATKTN